MGASSSRTDDGPVPFTSSPTSRSPARLWGALVVATQVIRTLCPRHVTRRLMAVCSTARATDPSTPCSPRRPTKLRHQPRPARLNGPLPPAELGACFTLGRAKLVQLKPRSLTLPTGEWQARFIKSMYSALPHMATKGCFCSYCSWPTSWTTVYRQQQKQLCMCAANHGSS